MATVDLQPTLSSPLVDLRPLGAADWEAFFAAAADPLIWEVHPAHDRWQEPVCRAYFEQGLASGGAMAAVDPSTGALIGSSRYDRGRAGAGEVEIGWTFLTRDRWGGKTNRAMKRLMVGHALRFFDRVIFMVGETNIRSRRAMEKIGGVLTDRIDETELAGKMVRHVVYAIDRHAFADGPLGRS